MRGAVFQFSPKGKFFLDSHLQKLIFFKSGLFLSGVSPDSILESKRTLEVKYFARVSPLRGWVLFERVLYFP